MIKITKAMYKSDYSIELFFSDGKRGIFNTSDLINRDTVMVKPLKNLDYFKTFFLELGALCWKNGFELSAASLYLKLKENNKLADAGNEAA